jgi:hypothetical protein
MPESHTGTNVARVILDAVKEWGLPPNPPLVTDNASNMTVAAKEAGCEPHIGCFAHTLNLACGKALKMPAVSKLLARIRRIVAYFHRSAIGTTSLKEKQILLNLPEHKLIIDVQTRWNSAVDMVARFLEQQPAVYAALTSPELRGKDKDVSTLSEDDIICAEELIVVLTPLKTATVSLCEEKVPTLSIVLPLQQHLLDYTMATRDDDSKFKKDVKSAVADNLRNRYTSVKKELLTATILDPRFKMVPFLSEEEKLEAYQSLTMQAVKMCEAAPDPRHIKTEPSDTPPTQGKGGQPDLPTLPAMPTLLESPESPAKKKVKQEPSQISLLDESCATKPSALSNLFGDVYIVQVEPAKPTVERVELEVSRYKSADPIPVSTNPLAWWREQSTSFPILARLAKKFLSIPSTSVPSERVFSTAGDIVTAQRSALKSVHVDRLIFLKKNWDA